MIKENEDVAKAAKEYIQKGYSVIPVFKKKPARFLKEEQEDGSIKKVSNKWEKSNIKLEQVDEIFTHDYLELPPSTPINIGIFASKNNLLDIDLDCEESRQLASYYLPKTRCIFGRATSPNSHWLYQSVNSEYFKYSYLSDPQDKKSAVTLLEIRPLNGTVKQTVFPPSTHYPTGERISFSQGNNEDPQIVDFNEIKLACDRLCVASLISRHLDEGVRQDIVIALAGTLSKAGWENDEILDFIDPIIKEYDEQGDYRTRIQGISKTLSKNEAGTPVTGITKLKELLPDNVFQKIKLWLGISKTEFPVFESNNCMYFRRITSKGITIERLTSFSIKPVKSIHVPDEGTYLHCLLITESGRTLEVTFSPESFESSSKFKRTLSRYGNDHTVYLGSDTQIQLIKEFLSMLNKDEVLGSNCSGFNTVRILNEKRTYFITEEGGLTNNSETGKIEHSESISFINNLSSSCKLVTTETPWPEELDIIKPFITDFNSPEIVQGILGWTIASFFKDFFIYHTGLDGFPVLFISGGSGSGKSKTAKNIIHNIWGIESQLKSFIEQSNFTIVKYMGSSNNIPIVFDEAKLNRMSKFRQDIFSNLIRISYDNSIANKGRQDQTIVNYKYSRPLVLCSETGLTESAHLDRTVFINFSLIKSREHSDSFQKLSSMDLSVLGRAVIDYVLTTDPKKIKKDIMSHYDKIPKVFEDRPRVCLCAISYGLGILGELLRMKIEPKELFEKQGEHFYSDSHDSGTRVSEVDKTLITWCLMSNFAGEHAIAGSYTYDPHLEENEHYKVKDGKINLHVPSIFPLFRKWDKTYEHQGDLLDQKTFLQQVKEEPYFIENGKNVKIGSKSPRCLVLDLEKILKKGVELSESWTIDHKEN